jgi:dimethylallyldiphosphate transferase
MDVPEAWNDDTEIPCGDHLRGNVIFNFEIWPGARLPIPKVYLSVAYYGKPDLKIAEGMDVFFQSQGWDHTFHSYKSNYVKIYQGPELGGHYRVKPFQ